MTALLFGQQVIIHGTTYTVRCGIHFKSDEDDWEEYELVDDSGRSTWLSMDDGNNEYAIYRMVGSDFEGVNYMDFPCDSGVARVVSSFGSDCDDGESVRFEEYEDPEGKIYAIERWSDETEYSIGVKVDLSDLEILEAPAGARGFSSSGSSKGGTIITVAICVIVGVLYALLEFGGCSCSSSKTFDKCIDSSTGFTYATSLTSASNKEKADISTTSQSVDAATKAILNCMDGGVKDVMQSSIDNNEAVSMIDAKQYVLVYKSTSGKTLVQKSSRKFAFANDTELYEADEDTKSWYQMYYHERAYADDARSFSDSADGHRNYHSTHVFFVPTGPGYYNYNNYNNTLRSQRAARRSGSGSHHSGK
ncbi:MAG: DUF4178 domain-containing protein [Proteobacteria bacterium]|nr:DUF4178 domain-containing protein [Pseudomonadota bacterium]